MTELPGTVSTEAITAALLDDLMAEAGPLAAQAHALLFPVAEARATLRTALLEAGQILKIGDPDPTARSLAAVDGGSVREHLYAADLMVVVAASAAGLSSVGDVPLQQAHWAKIVAHESENDRILSAAMASLELTLLNALAHDIRILDGSHGSPLISLSTALSCRSETAQALAADLITDEVLAAVWALGSPNDRTYPGEVVALPKADSSHEFTDMFHRAYGLILPGGDRFVAAQVLEPGEILYPRPAKEHTNLHVPVPENAPPQVIAAAADLAEAVKPLRYAAQERHLVVTYLKPESSDTVVKAEVRLSEPLPTDPTPDSVAVQETRRMCRIISDETPAPYLQEPFAQYAVDLAAKTVSVGTEALNQGMLANLPDGADAYLTLLARSYRTKNSTGPTRPGAATPRPGGR